MKLNLPNDYYGVGYSLFSSHTVNIEPGLTILVGCNGSGKTTFLRMCKDILNHKKNTLVISHSNVYDGGHIAKDRACLENRFDSLARLTLGSEGEAMVETLGILAKDVGLAKRKSNAKNIWILLDAMDSGFSIDNIIEMKDFLRHIQEVESDRKFYIILSANAYELARGERCLDIQDMEYVNFDSYDDYRGFVERSRTKRDTLAGLCQ